MNQYEFIGIIIIILFITRNWENSWFEFNSLTKKSLTVLTSDMLGFSGLTELTWWTYIYFTNALSRVSIIFYLYSPLTFQPSLKCRTWGRRSLVQVTDPFCCCLAPCRICTWTTRSLTRCTGRARSLQWCFHTNPSFRKSPQSYCSDHLSSWTGSDSLRTAHSCGRHQSYAHRWWGLSPPSDWICTDLCTDYR